MSSYAGDPGVRCIHGVPVRKQRKGFYRERDVSNFRTVSKKGAGQAINSQGSRYSRVFAISTACSVSSNALLGARNSGNRENWTGSQRFPEITGVEHLWNNWEQSDGVNPKIDTRKLGALFIRATSEQMILEAGKHSRNFRSYRHACPPIAQLGWHCGASAPPWDPGSTASMHPKPQGN
jgi:hypothetical protein